MPDWAYVERIGLMVDAASGVLFLGLGLVVGLVRPRTPVGFSFSVMAISFGVNRGVQNVLFLTLDSGHPTALVFGGVTNILVSIGAVGMGLLFPWRLPARRLVPVTAILLAPLAAWPVYAATGFGRPTAGLALSAFNAVAYDLHAISLAFFCATQALRWPDLTAHGRQNSAMAAGALAFSVGAISGFGLLAGFEPSGPWGPDFWNPALAWLAPVVAVVWLRASGRAVHGRRARDQAWLNLTIMALTTLYVATIPLPIADSQNLGIFGLARIIGVTFVAYAIARYRLFDIDVRVKLGIRQSTVAAIIITTIFILSEGAQILFGEDRAWLGILAGGALVFALAPLQRIGDRVADAALPDARRLLDRTLDERLRMYGSIAQAAWHDGTMTRAEARVLVAAREQLGLTPTQVAPLDASARG